MKKILSITLALSLSLAVFAQKNFQLGLQLSPNISWINPDSDGLDSEGSKVGFSYGLIGDFNISENYAFSTGITLLSSGGKISYPDRQDISSIGDQPGRTTADVRLKYIQVPLTLKLKTNQIGYMKYYGQFGFGAAFNYDTKADKEFKYLSTTTSEDEADYGSEINLFRASLIVGLGAEYNLSGNT
ncbi:MAG: porin family protein, partial [Vicingaceae bacterium]